MANQALVGIYPGAVHEMGGISLVTRCTVNGSTYPTTGSAATLGDVTLTPTGDSYRISTTQYDRWVLPRRPQGSPLPAGPLTLTITEGSASWTGDVDVIASGSDTVLHLRRTILHTADAALGCEKPASRQSLAEAEGAIDDVAHEANAPYLGLDLSATRYENTFGTASTIVSVPTSTTDYLASHARFGGFRLYGITKIPARQWRARTVHTHSQSGTPKGTGAADALAFFVYRPSTGTLVGRINDTTAAPRANPSGGKSAVADCANVWTFTGNEVPGIQDGDVLCVGLYSLFSNPHDVYSGTATAKWDGAIRPETNGAEGSGDDAQIETVGWDLFNPPDLFGITPDSGPTVGGTAVTGTGTGLAGATGASIGGVAVSSFAVAPDGTSWTGVTGPHAEGVVDVVVHHPSGDLTLPGAFTYVDTLSISPSHGPASGGTAVTLSTNGWTSGAVVTVDGGAPGSLVVGASSITFTTLAHHAGPVTVSVTANGITKTATFTYDLVVSPNSGPDTGGTSVRIIGVASGSPTFGGSAATGVAPFDWNSITCVTPPHAAGTVDVVVGSLTAVNAFTFLSTLPESDTTGCAPILEIGESVDSVGLDRLSSLGVTAYCGDSVMVAGLRFPLAAAKMLFRRATMLVEELHRDAAGDPVGTWHVFEGEVQAEASSSAVRFSVESYAQKLKGEMIPRSPISERCSNAFCDEACGLSRSALTVSAVSTVTGYRTTIATPSAAVLATPVGRFTGGSVAVTSGPMAGQSRTILSDTLYGGLRVLTLTSPLPGILGSGESLSVFPDCAKTPPACDAYGNLPRYRGQPFVPTDGQVSQDAPPTGIRGAPMRFVVTTQLDTGSTTGSGFVTGVFATIPLMGVPKAVTGATVSYTAGEGGTITAAAFTWNGGASVEVERPAIDASIPVAVEITCEWYGIEPQDLENVDMYAIFPAGGNVNVQAETWLDSSGTPRNFDGIYRVAAVRPSAALLDGPELVNAGWAAAVLPSPYITMAVVGV